MTMTPEERALKIAPEGCDGKHPKGGCLFEQVRDAIYETEKATRREVAEEYIRGVDHLVDVEKPVSWNKALWEASRAIHLLVEEGGKGEAMNKNRVRKAVQATVQQIVDQEKALTLGTRIITNEQAMQSLIMRYRLALETIAGLCENYRDGDCFTNGKTVGAKHGADAVCDQCLANRALGRRPS